MKYIDIDEIELHHIETFYDLNSIEQKTHEYKRQLNIQLEKEKKEFLCDVASFANSEGGDLIIGICERGGVIGFECNNIDNLRQQIDQIVSSGITPRISYRIQHVVTDDSKYILVMRILSTAQKPHLVIQDKYYRFYIRNETGKIQMDYFQIKHAFLGQAEQSRQMDLYVADRVSQIIIGNTPIKLINWPLVIFHIIPISNFLENNQLNFDWNCYKGETFRPFSENTYAPNHARRHTFDGYLVTLEDESFLEVKRTGVIEAVGAKIINKYESEFTNKDIPVKDVEENFLKGFQNYLALFIEMGLKFPALIYLNIFGVKGFKIPTFENNLIHDNHLNFGNILVDENNYDKAILFKPWFDMFYQSLGKAGTSSYRSGGMYIGNSGNRYV